MRLRSTPPGPPQNAAKNRYGQGLPPAGGWKLAMREDPAEYSPEFQDEYRRLWHEAALERDRFKAALSAIAQFSCMGTPWNAYVDVKRIANEALDA